MGPHLVDSPILCLGISFVPKETGEHLVHEKKNGQHVASSPIPVVISQSEIGDASRVRVSGQGLHEGHTFEPAEFIIDTRDAGRQCGLLVGAIQLAFLGILAYSCYLFPRLRWA